jgi:hypothetical protein
MIPCVSLHELSKGWSVCSARGTELTFHFIHRQLTILATDSDSSTPVWRTFVAYDSPIMPAMPHLRLVSELLTPFDEVYYVYEEYPEQLIGQIRPTREERLRQARQERMESRQERLQARKERLEASRKGLEAAWADN